MTTPIITRNFFKLTEKQMMKIGRNGSGVLGKMEESVKNLSESVLDTVAHQSRNEGYLLKDQFIKLRTTGRKGGEYFKAQNGEIATDLTPVKPVKVRTETRGKQSVEEFTEEKLNLIAKFKNALRNETSEHVSVKFATEGGGLRRRKITDKTVDRYKEAVAAFNHSSNKDILDKFGEKPAKKVETQILKQGQFQIRQTIPSVRNAEGNLTAPAKKITVKLAQGKQETTEYVNNGLQVAKQIQERPDTIGKKFLLNNTTTQTFRGRVPSEAKIQEYKKAKASFATNERWIDDIIVQEADYAEGNYSRRLTGKNQYVVQKRAEGSKERYTLTPHKESLSQFVDNANQFAKEVAFQRPEISPRLMVKRGHLDSTGIKQYGTAQTIFKDVPRFDAEADTLKMRLKGNGKFSIKDVRPQPAAAEGTATNVAEQSDEPLRSIKLRQGSQDFGNFVENGIRFANQKKQHNQFMSESFGVKGNWLTGNRVKDKGLARREEAIQFFDANKASLKELQEAGLSFKLRKHGKIALQYGKSNTRVKSLSQRDDEGLTGFLTRGVKEARGFVAEQEQKAARPSLLLSAAQQQRHTQLREAVSNLDSGVLPEGFSLVPHNGKLLIQKNGRTLETLNSRDCGKQPANDILQGAVNSAHLYNEAPETPSRLSGLRNRFPSRPEATESKGQPGFLNRLFGRKNTETTPQAPAVDKSTISHPLEAQGGNQGRMNDNISGVPVSGAPVLSGNVTPFGGIASAEQVVRQDGGHFRQGSAVQPTLVDSELSRYQSTKVVKGNAAPLSPISVEYRTAPSSPVSSLPQAPPPAPPRPTQAELSHRYPSQYQTAPANVSERPVTPFGTPQGASLPSPVVPSFRPFSPVQVQPLREYWARNAEGHLVRVADI